MSAEDTLREKIRSLIYRRYDSSDGAARAFLQFNRARDGWLDFDELRSGLGRLFGMRDLDREKLWQAFGLDRCSRPGKLTLEEFATRLEARGGVSLVDTGMSSGVHVAAATPRQDSRASFRHLRAAARQDPTRVKSLGLSAKADDSSALINGVVEKLQRTEMSMRKLFREMDASRNNRLDAQELIGAMRACGAHPADFGIAEAETVIEIFDRNGDSEITFSDFVRLLAYTEKEEETREHLQVDAAAPPSQVTNVLDNRRSADTKRVKAKPPTAFPVSGAVRTAAARASATRAAVSVSKKMGLSNSLSAKEYRAIKQISDAVYGSRRKVRQLFRMMDTDGDKRLDAAELQAGLSECGLKIDLEEIARLVGHFCKDGGLSFSKFVKLLAAKE